MNLNSTQDVTVVDGYSLANPSERIIAFLIDIFIYSIILSLLLVSLSIINLGWLAGSFAVWYLILRDNIPFLNYQSIGKKIMKLKVIKANDGIKINAFFSIKRNFIFLPLVFPFGVSFVYAAATIIFFLMLIELCLMYAYSDNQRLGDQFAETLVIENCL